MPKLNINVRGTDTDTTLKQGVSQVFESMRETGRFDKQVFIDSLDPFVKTSLDAGLAEFGAGLRDAHDPRLMSIPLVSDSWKVETESSADRYLVKIQNTQPRKLVPSLPRSGKARGGFGTFKSTIEGGWEFWFWLKGNSPNYNDKIYPKGTVGHGYRTSKNIESKARLPPGSVVSDIDVEAKAIAFYVGGQKIIRSHVLPRGDADENQDKFARMTRFLVRRGIESHARGVNDKY